MLPGTLALKKCIFDTRLTLLRWNDPCNSFTKLSCTSEVFQFLVIASLFFVNSHTLLCFAYKLFYPGDKAHFCFVGVLRVLTKFVNSWTSAHYCTLIGDKSFHLNVEGKKASLSWEHKRFRILYCFWKDISIPKRAYAFFLTIMMFLYQLSSVLCCWREYCCVCWLALFKVYFFKCHLSAQNHFDLLFWK